MSSHPGFLLEIIIPTYQRPMQLLRCVDSVTSQITRELAEFVGIAVWDDGSDLFPLAEINSLIEASAVIHARVGQNSINKGMSQNIYDLFESSCSDYVSVLSDDDLLHPGSLTQIVQSLQLHGSNLSVGAAFFPRSCYSEEGNYLFSVCKTFETSTLIESSPVSSLRYAHNGFVLTGLFLRRRYINFAIWLENIENSFFPVIVLSSVLRSFNVLYVDKDLFVHTVNNEVHWDRWGKTDDARSLRLLSDYINTLELITAESLSGSLKVYDLQSISNILYFHVRCLRKQYSSHLSLPKRRLFSHAISSLAWSPFRVLAFSLSMQAHLRSRLGLPTLRFWHNPGPCLPNSLP